jgi:hypothetical protein
MFRACREIIGFLIPLQQLPQIKRASNSRRRKMLVTSFGALMIDNDNFEKNTTSIYVTNGVGSRFFSNFSTNVGLFCSKYGNEKKLEFGAE